MTEKEHLAWSKKRALEICDRGEVAKAFASLISDLNKHPETQGHTAIKLGKELLEGGHLDHQYKMAQFIEGFR